MKAVAKPSPLPELAALDTSPWHHRHVLDLDDFSIAEMELVFSVADVMMKIFERKVEEITPLHGKTVVNFFFEASTRTRISFEVAANTLGASVVNVTAAESSIQKGESLIDTFNTLEALGADIVVMRHSQSGAPYLASKYLTGGILNGGDGWHAHPTQALLDLYTIRRHKGEFKGLKAVILGDLLHSRVVRSNIWGMTRLGMDVTLCGPPTLMPSAYGKQWPELPKFRITYDIKKAVKDADVVMMLRMQKERQQAGLLPSLNEYIQFWQFNAEHLALAKPDALVMHPGPMNEGIEISSDVAHGPQSTIDEQVTSGVATRMALLYLLGRNLS